MAVPTTPYDYAEPLTPTAVLTDFTLMVDLSRMTAGWWSAVNTTQARRGRAFKDDGVTELACDWIDFDSVARTGWLRVKFSGNMTNKNDNTIRIYPPNTANSPVGSGSALGSDNAYDSGWSQYLPLVSDFSNRIAGSAEYIADIDATAPTIGTLGGKDALLLNGTNNLVSTTNLSAFGHSTVLAWFYETANEGQGVATGMNYNSIRFTQRSYAHNDVDRSLVTLNSAVYPSVANAWVHAAASNGDTDAYFLRDGVDLTDVIVDPLPWSNSEAKKLTIGARAEGHSYWLTGGLSDIQLHSVQRPNAWIAQEYAQTNSQAAFWGTWNSAGGSLVTVGGDQSGLIDGSRVAQTISFGSIIGRKAVR